MKEFELTVLDLKAKRTYTKTVKAKDDKAAVKQFRKAYGSNSYDVVNVKEK